MFDQKITAVSEELVKKASGLGVWISTAESCTGGLIAGALTSVAGASACVGAGFVTYSNEAKMDALHVTSKSLDLYGAVSSEVAGEMARGAQAQAKAHLAIAVTGIAGPGGGSAEKPVGLVYIAAAGGTSKDALRVKEFKFGDIGRSEVRRETVLKALELGLEALNSQS
ncbi:MAG: competence damage-inducible protein A [Methyloligella sp.]|nr:MAG: competence damage-inducible protein A [Methyloligella sp.]